MLSLQLPLPPFQTKMFAVSSSYNSKPTPPTQFRGSLRSFKTFSHLYSSSSSSYKYHRKPVASTADITVKEVEDEDDGVSREALPAGLRRECMPNHLAVIMDGNVRWAQKRGLPSVFGHRAGVKALKDLIDQCCKCGIRVLTVFAFSNDNWNRPKLEVGLLMKLFEEKVKEEMDFLMRKSVRLSVIGDFSKVPSSLYELLKDSEESTKHNSRLHLIVALSYSGKRDIVQACQSIARRVKDDLIKPEDVNESLIEQELETKCTEYPYPDLLIRTSGEFRISNFLVWQMAFTEFFFVKSLWPDFNEADLVEALQSFQQRKRRYGGRNSISNGDVDEDSSN